MIISGKELSAKMKAAMAEEVKSFPEKYGRVPHLAVILVGDNPASVSYVTGKAKASADDSSRGHDHRGGAPGAHRRAQCRRRGGWYPGAAPAPEAHLGG